MWRASSPSAATWTYYLKARSSRSSAVAPMHLRGMDCWTALAAIARHAQSQAGHYDRERMKLWLVAAAALVGLTAAMVLFVFAYAGPRLTDRIAAGTAIVEALSALAIVALSLELALYRAERMRTAQDQAAAAAASLEGARIANKELRLERELSVMPFSN